jgi:hypothetical protein
MSMSPCTVPAGCGAGSRRGVDAAGSMPRWAKSARKASRVVGSVIWWHFMMNRESGMARRMAAQVAMVVGVILARLLKQPKVMAPVRRAGGGRRRRRRRGAVADVAVG